ncbi:MAG: hypothetical protein V7647_1995 [Acidobacteriota bacterium]
METQRRYLGLVRWALALVAVVSTSAVAEPITATYDVHIVQRYNYRTDAYEWYSQQFALRMTFDPASRSEGSTYGAAVFSRIPLDVPGPLPGTHQAVHAFTNHHAEVDPDAGNGTYRQYALAAAVTNAPDDRFYRVLWLESYVRGLSSAPTVSAATFPIHLGTVGGDANNLNGYGNFLFGAYQRMDDPAVREGWAYWGDALLRQVETGAPVPEPGTWLLVAGGLGLLARRGWRVSVRMPRANG